MAASRNYRSLRADRIIETLAALERRVFERFPNSGLRAVANEAHNLSREVAQRAERMRRPNLPLRFLIGVLVLGFVTLIAFVITQLRLKNLDRLLEVDDFVQSTDAAMGIAVFVGVTVIFLVSLEIRMKRAKALSALHELRALAHIVDMHQLTKDPESVFRSGPSTQSSPKRTLTAFELGRYLDYCSELLSLIAKMGALYAQELPDPTVQQASDQLASLTNGLTRNIWQKIMILERAAGPAGSAGSASAEPFDPERTQEVQNDPSNPRSSRKRVDTDKTLRDE